MHKGNTEFEIFDLENYPGEIKNIAGHHLEIIEQVQKIILSEHQRSANEKWRFKLLDTD